jgi:hypothetical protein
MDPAARLNIDEAIVNIGAEKIDELPDSTAAKERTLVSVIDTGVNEQHVTATLRFLYNIFSDSAKVVCV